MNLILFMRYMLILNIFFVFVSCDNLKTEQTGLEGKPLPAFSLLLMDGETYINTKDIPVGKPLVLFYFGPNCPYSRSQMADIINNIDDFKDARLIIFSTTYYQDTKQFYDHYKLSLYENITTGIDSGHVFKDYYNAVGVPYIAIFNKDKTLKETYLGKVNAGKLAAIMNE